MKENNSLERAFLNLIGSIINDKIPMVLTDGISADEIFEIGARQDMAPITFCALNMIMPKPLSNKWYEHQKRFLDDSMRSEIQMSEYRKLLEYLCQHGVKILPLKGCVLKDLYPAPNFRAMNDVDLLYDGVTPEELSKLMELAGYSIENLETGCHDVFHKKPCLKVELHRKLVSDENPYRTILENMFEKAVIDENIDNLYHMKSEDLYIHIIVHAANHFKESGLGVRPLLDVYVLNHKFDKEWDRNYIKKQLESVGLEKFENKIQEISYTFFGEEEKIISDEDIKVFFQGSIYGECAQKVKRTAITSGNNNRRFILKKIFLPLSELKVWFPVLKKHPYLYPFVSVYRWIDRLIHRTFKVKQVMQLSHIPQEDINSIKNIMKEYGL